MSDFIREVDGEYRQEQFLRFLSRYWLALALAVVAVLAATGGWRYSEYRREGQAEAAGARYLDAVEAAATDPKASMAELDAIGRDGPSGYRLLARLRAAGELGRTDAAGAAKLFDAVAADGTVPQEFRDVAALRAGLLSVDAADPAELRRRLEPLADANSAYRSVAREMLAAAAMKGGDDAAAGRWLDLIEADRLASAQSRQRAGFMLAVLRASRPFSPPAPAAPAAGTAPADAAGAAQPPAKP